MTNKVLLLPFFSLRRERFLICLYLWTSYRALGTVLGAGDAPGTKICMVLARVEFRSARGETTN